MTPTGLEQAWETYEKSQELPGVPLLVPLSRTITRELIEVLQRLSPENLLAVIEYARALDGGG